MVIRRSLVYALLTLSLAGLFVVLQGLAGAALQAKTGSTSMPSQLLAALTVAAMFGPAERWLQAMMEKLFNGPRLRRVAELQRLAEELDSADDPDRRAQRPVARVAAAMEVADVALFRRQGPSGEYHRLAQSGLPTPQTSAAPFPDGSGLVAWLAADRRPLQIAALQRDERFQRIPETEKRRFAVTAAAVAMPIVIGAGLGGFMLLGAPRELDLLFREEEEEEALLMLSHQAGRALREAEMAQRLRVLEREHAALQGRLRLSPTQSRATGRTVRRG